MTSILRGSGYIYPNNRLGGIRIQTSLFGMPIPIVGGRNRIAPNILWYGDFVAQHVAGGKKGASSGGSSGKKGQAEYDYGAAVILGLCQGPIQRVGNIWANSGYLPVNLTQETFTVPSGGGQYVVTQVNTFLQDMGVQRADFFSVPSNDFASPYGAITLTGTQQTPMSYGAGTGHYSQSGGTYTFYGGDAGKIVTISYTYAPPITTGGVAQDPITTIGFSFFNGAQGQAPWGYMSSRHPTQALGYTTIAYAATPRLDLGVSGTLPNFNFEIYGLDHFGRGVWDCDPSVWIQDMLTNAIWGVGFSVNDIGSMNQMSNYCVDPKTRILTADLRWIPASEIKVGCSVLAFDEESTVKRSGRGTWKGRQWKVSEIQEKRIIKRPCYKIHLSDGTTLISSAEHLWLASRGEEHHYHWIRTDQLMTNRFSWGRKWCLFKAIATWSERQEYQAGYLAAAFDGEGSFSQGRRYWAHEEGLKKGCGTTSLSFAQKPNAMLHATKEYLHDFGFMFSERPRKDHDLVDIQILGGITDYLRFVGTVRPHRLLENFDPAKLGKFARKEAIAVIGLEYIGEQEVVALQTSEHTFIAEGFASHNCVANGLFISPVCDEQRTAGDYIKDWLEATNTEIVESGGVLTFIPRGDTTTVGNGVTFTPQTAPIYGLDDSAFIRDGQAPPVKVRRPSIQDAYNSIKIEYVDVFNNYNPSVVEAQDLGAIQRYRYRPEGQRNWHFFTQQTPAALAAQTLLVRKVYIRNTYEFKLSMRYLLLDPMDIVTIPAHLIYGTGLNQLVWSQNFENVWTIHQIVTPSPGIVAPDGTLTAEAFVATAGATDSYALQVVGNITAGAPYIFSVWLKVPSGTKSTNIYLYAVTGATLVPVTVTSAWKRFLITGISSGTSLTVQIGGGGTFTSGEIDAWGTQLEPDSGSHIPSIYSPTQGKPAYTPDVAVRLISVTENSDNTLSFEAEDFPWGCSGPTLYPKQIPNPGGPNPYASPGSVNIPIIFEALERLNNQIGHAIWFGLSGSNSNWGGCQIWVSLDGGSTYQHITTAVSPTKMGVLTSQLVSHTDPDTVDSFGVDLTESFGQLASVTQVECDANATLSFISSPENAQDTFAPVITAFYLQDPAGQIWQLSVTDAGVLQTIPASVTGTIPKSIVLNAADGGSWSISVDTSGVLTAIRI